MSPLDRDVLGERAMAVERHLARVAARLPDRVEAFQRSTDMSDAVILHLWQATQTVIDLAMAACLYFKLGAPASYADAFERLRGAGLLERDLAARLSGAAGFRNVIAHAYDQLDMVRVYHAAQHGPTDLRRFIAVLRDSIK